MQTIFSSPLSKHKGIMTDIETQNAKKRTYYRTIVLSDIHLGTVHSKAKEVCDFLEQVQCKTLILNGDIIDGWALQKAKKNGWKKKHTNFFKQIIKMMSRDNTKVIYLRGNHDDFLDNVLPFKFVNINIVNSYTLLSNNKRYLVTHGDIFDNITSGFNWLAKIGDIGYTFLLWLNKYVNKRRLRKGLPYYSISQKVKHQVKQAVSYISDYENELVKFAQNRKAQGIICGHIHQPADRMINDIHYLNSGDWVESLTALTEDDNGKWEIFHYDKNKINLDSFGE